MKNVIRKSSKKLSEIRFVSPGRRLLPAFAILVCLVSPLIAQDNVDFPGAVDYPMFSAPLSATRVEWSDGVTDYLVVGDDSGQLNLVRHLFGDIHFSTFTRLELGGPINWVGNWEYSHLGERGIVAATTNPDQLHFIEIAYSSPHIRVLQSLDLPEDPGGVAFLGPDTQGRPQLVLSLPGIDQVLIIRQELGQWSIIQTVDAGDEPRSLVAIDVDQDEVLEFVTADRGFLSGTLSVFGQEAEGDYALREQVKLSGHALQVGRGDFDFDGDRELVVSYKNLAQVDIVTFDAGLPTVDHSIFSTVAPDYFQVVSSPAGNPGLVTAVQEQGLMEFFLRIGGDWHHQDSYYVGCRPIGLAACDLNGDGMSEIACIGGSENKLGILLGNTLPGFWGYSASALPTAPMNAQLADFDGNGTLDFVVCGGNPGVQSLFLRQPDGELLDSPIHRETDFFPGALVCADFLGDHKKELLVQDLFSARLVLQVYAESLGLTTHSTINLVGNPSSVGAADVDGDGFTDVILSYTTRRQVEILFGVGDGSFDQDLVVDLSFGAAGVVALGLDPGPHLDLLVSDGQSRVWSLENLNGRSFGTPVANLAAPGAKHMTTFDLDDDGDLDVVVNNTASESISVFENKGDGSLQNWPSDLYLPSQPTDIEVGDLDGDGIPDLLMTLEGNESLLLFLASGVWQYAYGIELPSLHSPVKPLVSDFNNDGNNDILVFDEDLLLAMIMANTEMSLVDVAADALAVECFSGDMRVRILPDRLGPWELAIGNPGNWVVLAADGEARIGRLDSDGQAWLLRASQQDLSLFDESMELRLTVGMGAQQEFLALDLTAGCFQETGSLPQLRWMDHPWPNPFNPRIQGRIQLDAPADVDVAVFDPAGRRVATLLKGSLPAGIHAVSWDGRQDGRPVAGGLYLLRARSDNTLISRKIVLLK
jgi:FG-GAP-like repeat/FlgD Ig-like domain/FG-GAP repeat